MDAWKRMAVKSNKGDSIESESLQKYSDWLSKEKLGKMKTAAVLIGLFEKENEWYFPLIKRPMHEKNHPGQIALPGGAKEKGENIQETARREAFEEVGILPEKVKIIGKLTPLPVPVSNYLIHPFVGILKEEPDWKINSNEVEELIILKMKSVLLVVRMDMVRNLLIFSHNGLKLKQLIRKKRNAFHSVGLITCKFVMNL